MSDPQTPSLSAPLRTEEQKLHRELPPPEKQNWWLLGHSIFVIALLVLVVIPFSIPGLSHKAQTQFGIKAADVVLGLAILVVLFDPELSLRFMAQPRDAERN